MSAAGQLAALLVKEEAALRRGDAEAVFLLAEEKEDLVIALRDDPPAEDVLSDLIEKNRTNGMLARSGLALLNQVLGNSSAYGQEAQSKSGQILSESA